MKILLLTTITCLISSTVMGQVKNGITVITNAFENQSIEAGLISLTSRDSGMRFLYRLDTAEPRVLKYNEKLTLPIDFKVAIFSNRGYSIQIKNNGDETLTVLETIDQRSAKGECECSEFLVKIVDGQMIVSQ